MTRNLLVTVDDHLRAFRRHRRQGDLAARHQTIASEHEVGCTQVQLHRSDVVFRLGQANMAGHRPALLRHAELIDRRENVAFHMGAHR